MKTNVYENEIQEFRKLIDNCMMIEPMAKVILKKTPFAWVRIATTAFDFTVKGKNISVNSFNSYLINRTFIEFLEILENNKITLAVNEGNLVFLGTGDIEDILLNSLFPYK